MLQPMHPLPLFLLSVSELMVGKNQQQHKKQKPETYGLKIVNFLGQDTGKNIKENGKRKTSTFIF
jgi:hypothetical protein